VLAHYVAGLAVECLLRAYRLRLDTAFDERHDLRELAKHSGFWEIVPGHQRKAIGVKFSEVMERWQNNHRYRCEDSLKRFLKQKKLYSKIKGNFVKESSRKIVDAALDVVTIGAKAW
jgi:hypothetical protein